MQTVNPGSTDIRTAVITGAASGIGRAAVDVFLRRQWRVLAIDKDARGLEDGLWRTTDSRLRSELTMYPLDVARGSDVAAWQQTMSTEYPCVDALVNAAGIGLFARSMEDTGDDEWQTVIAVNLGGPFFMTKALIPQMKIRGGQIVNLSSVHAVATSFGMSAYASSKAGLVGLTRSVAVDYRSAGIRANCLIIGSVDTPMSHQHQMQQTDRGAPPLVIDQALIANPVEIATVIYFLCSNEARFINGAAITVDGGLLSEL